MRTQSSGGVSYARVHDMSVVKRTRVDQSTEAERGPSSRGSSAVFGVVWAVIVGYFTYDDADPGPWMWLAAAYIGFALFLFACVVQIARG